MADPRLQWRPLSQEQANVAPLLRNSNLAFNEAADAASGILDSYDKGRKAIGDKEAAHRLAGLNDEAEMDAFLAKGGLSDLNVSDEMLANLGKSRKDVLGYANDRSIVTDRDARTGVAVNDSNSQIRDRDGRLGIAQNNDARVGTLFDQGQVEYGEGREREKFLKENAADFTNSELAAVNNGTDLRGYAEGVDWKKYAVGGAASREDSFTGLQPEMQGRMGNMLKDAEAAGLNLKITSGYRSSDVQGNIVSQNMAKYGLGNRRAEWDADVKSMGPEAAGKKWRPIMREAGLTKFVAMPGGSQHQKGNAVDFADANGGLLRDPNSPEAKWLKANAPKYGLAVPMSHEPWQVELGEVRGGGGGGSAPPQDAPAGGGTSTGRGFGGDGFTNKMATSGLFTPQQILAAVDPLRKAGAEGDAKNVTERQQLQADLLAGIMETTIKRDDVVTPEQMADALRTSIMETNEFSESEASAATNGAIDLIEQNPEKQGQLAPAVAEDIRGQNIIDGASQDLQSAMDSTVQGRIMRDTKAFEADPTQGLIDALNLGKDGQNPGGISGWMAGESGFDSDKLKKLIDTYAADNKVSPAKAAAAMREAFQRDPGALYNPTTNTLANRFPATSVKEIIAENLDQEGSSQFQDKSRQRAEYDQQLNKLNTEIQKLQVAAKKGGDRTEIASRITDIYTEMSQIRKSANELYRGN